MYRSSAYGSPYGPTPPALPGFAFPTEAHLEALQVLWSRINHLPGIDQESSGTSGNAFQTPPETLRVSKEFAVWGPSLVLPSRFGNPRLGTGRHAEPSPPRAPASAQLSRSTEVPGSAALGGEAVISVLETTTTTTGPVPALGSATPSSPWWLR